MNDSQSGSVGVPTGEVSVEQGSGVIRTITLSNGLGSVFTSRHGNLPRNRTHHRELRRRLELQSVAPVIAGRSDDLSGLTLGHRKRQDNDLRFSPSNAQLDHIGICERTVTGHIGSDRPARVHHDRHDRQSSRCVPDHVHRRVTRLIGLHIRVRVGNTHGVTGFVIDCTEVSYRHGLL